MRAQEFANSKLVVFDIDDTLVNTNTLVNVVRDGEVVKQLNSHDFTHYHLQPGEEFDFGRFRDAREFYTNARPIAPMISRLKRDIATGNKVIMLTARADFNDRDVFLDTFRQYGIDMDRVHVYRAGNLQTRAATEEKKKIILRHLLGQRHYDKVIMYDDAVPNLNAFLSLAQEYPWSRFYAWHVDPQGRATEYHRTGASLGNKLREDDQELPSVERARAAIPQILARVQRDYDDWDEEDRDTYAGGGICHIIADTMCDVLSDLGIDCTPVSCSYEQHVYIAARFAEGIYTIDIPYHVYETGGGFSWQKIPDVKFSARDVVFYRTSGDPADWRDYIDEAVVAKTMAAGFEDQRQDGRWLLQARGNLGRGISIRVLDTDNNNREVAFVDFSVRERREDGEPYLRAAFVNVLTAYRGQGLARRMYQYANDLGNDIMPSDSQTEHGREMWQRLAGRVRQPPELKQPEPVAAPRSDVTKTSAPSWWQRLRGRATADVQEDLGIARGAANFVRNIGRDADAPIVMMTNPANRGARTASNQRISIEDFPLKTVAVAELQPWEPMIKMRDLPSQRTVVNLTQTLRKGGGIPPLLVTPVRGGYRIIDGHHRYAALQRAGINRVAVRVVDPRLIRYSDEVMEALRITLERYGHLGRGQGGVAEGRIKESNTQRNQIQDLLSQIPKLVWQPVNRDVWNAIQDEGLDEEQDAPNRTDWLMAFLSISQRDAQALQVLDDDAIEKFNRFDIQLKSRYPGLTDLIDYDNGTVTIVKTSQPGVREGRVKDMDMDLQDQQWEAVVGFVQDGLRRGRDADRMSIDLYRWAGGEMFDVDEELERRGFRSVTDLADHIRDHGGRYVAPQFDLRGATSLRDIERLERRRDDDVQENFAAVSEVNAAGELTVDPDLIRRFTDRGWEIDGEGRDQIVMSRPGTNIVLKIVGQGTDTHTGEIRRAVQFFRDHQHNPHFPRVGLDRTLDWKGQKYYAYTQERLRPLSGDEEILDYLEYAMGEIGHGQDPDYSQAPPGLAVEQVDGLVSAIYDMFDEGMLTQTNFDLGNVANIMQRANGQLVIVDPVSFDQDLAENFADGKVKGRSRPGRVKRAGASCQGSVTDLRARAKKYGGERGRMYHWCANMKSGKKNK